MYARLIYGIVAAVGIGLPQTLSAIDPAPATESTAVIQIDSHGSLRGNLSSEHREREGGTQQALPVGGATRAPEIDEGPQPVSWLRVEINIAARELSVFEHGQMIHRYPVAIGQPAYQSIEMNDYITRIEWNPWWYPPPSPWAAGASVTPPGPGNPLGPVKLPLGQGIRIHGTNKEGSVGRAASHGCFRMLNKDAVALAWYLQTHLTDQGDPTFLEKYTKNRRTTYPVVLTQPVPVDVVYEPVVVRDDVLYLYPDVYGRVRNWYDRVIAAMQTRGIDTAQLTQERIDELRKALRKGALEITLQELFHPPEPSPPLTKAAATSTLLSQGP